MQVGEFSSTVGLIKRCQQVFGRLFTVSGVIALFRKSALEEVGYWSVDMLTEDIDISWKLQTHGWEISYEPRALTWILTPKPSWVFIGNACAGQKAAYKPYLNIFLPCLHRVTA